MSDTATTTSPTWRRRHAVFDRALAAVDALAPDQVLIACNTLSIVYEHTAHREHPGIPVQGIVDTGVDLFDAALRDQPSAAIVLIGTRTTIDSGVHRRGPPPPRQWRAGRIGRGVVSRACDGNRGRPGRRPDCRADRHLCRTRRRRWRPEVIRSTSGCAAPITAWSPTASSTRSPPALAVASSRSIPIAAWWRGSWRTWRPRAGGPVSVSRGVEGGDRRRETRERGPRDRGRLAVHGSGTARIRARAGSILGPRCPRGAARRLVVGVGVIPSSAIRGARAAADPNEVVHDESAASDGPGRRRAGLGTHGRHGVGGRRRSTPPAIPRASATSRPRPSSSPCSTGAASTSSGAPSTR